MHGSVMQNDRLNRVAIYFIQIICVKSLINLVFCGAGLNRLEIEFKKLPLFFATGLFCQSHSGL